MSIAARDDSAASYFIITRASLLRRLQSQSTGVLLIHWLTPEMCWCQTSWNCDNEFFHDPPSKGRKGHWLPTSTHTTPFSGETGQARVTFHIVVGPVFMFLDCFMHIRCGTSVVGAVMTSQCRQFTVRLTFSLCVFLSHSHHGMSLSLRSAKQHRYIYLSIPRRDYFPIKPFCAALETSLLRICEIIIDY